MVLSPPAHGRGYLADAARGGEAGAGVRAHARAAMRSTSTPLSAMAPSKGEGGMLARTRHARETLAHDFRSAIKRASAAIAPGRKAG